ncbi:MAG: maltose alpha-D-glucosyltransferase [Pseudomonadota bacterium]|nr:maltose alpha-D-glucosyltransferase [Pseudomonadota bacterium]
MNDTVDTVSWENDPLWYKDAIIYQLHIKAYGDSNNDGYGDFKGLIERLDYIQDLGVNTIWLLPFYPSPLKDDGYDIADYKNVNPQYGERRDVKHFIREAHHRGLKVVTELVINHTSDQHPWFQAARRAPKGSRKRNFYVWNDDDKKWPETRIIFTDTELSNWTFDPVAGQYYWHRFFSHQPDLNFDNPEVLRAVIRIMRFWLDMGVDGMRLDAIPYLVERDGTINENLPETHDVLKKMRAVVDQHYQNRMFLAEANQWPEDVREYFGEGEGDECHVCYHFPLMPRMYMSVALEDRHPIIEIMAQTPDIPEKCQWAIFLRNHDELTLEMVTDKERDYMYRTYAFDPRMKINVGIRRRLAPLMDNDMDKIKLMNGMLLSMPGTPIIYYGDEIGMGDNIYLGDRNGVRTPMQWSPDRNAGFSKADPQSLYFPVIMDPVYGYQAVNVESQSRNPASLLNWMKRIIAVRKNYKAFGRGSLRFLHPGNRKILAYIREHQDEVMLCVMNLSRSAQPVELDLAPYKGRVPVELLGTTPFPPIGELPYLLTLPRHAFYWFRLDDKIAGPAWHQDWATTQELPVLVLIEGWRSFFPERFEKRKAIAQKLATQVEREVLPAFVQSQRWFAAKGEKVQGVRPVRRDIWQGGGGQWLLMQLQADFEGIPPQSYFLPLAIAWERRDNEEQLRALEKATLARVREQARMGVLYDAFFDETFCRALVRAIGDGASVALDSGQLQFTPTASFRELAGDDLDGLEIRHSTAGSSNTGVILGNRLFLKGYRRLQPGRNLELEIGRFLTETSPFANIVPVAGAVEYRGGDGTVTTLAMLQGYVVNQGDAWAYTLDYLRRALEDALVAASSEAGAPPPPEEELHAVNLMMMRTLGLRTGELHKALARQTGDPAFDPEPITPEDLAAWNAQVRQEAAQSLDKLARNLERLPEARRPAAEKLLAGRNEILERIARLRPEDLQAVKARYHGDYHLGQVLVSRNDFVIIDFEGEPTRSLEERQRKHSPLRDVAGMLRSLNYAAHATLLRMTGEKIADPDRLEPLARQWERLAVAAFMAGYEEGVQGCPVYPEAPTYARSLIDLFIVEKAFYELRYELDNRPDWIGVPLGGLLALLVDE